MTAMTKTPRPAEQMLAISWVNGRGGVLLQDKTLHSLSLCSLDIILLSVQMQISTVAGQTCSCQTLMSLQTLHKGALTVQAVRRHVCAKSHLSKQAQHAKVKSQHCNQQGHEQQRKAGKHPPMNEVTFMCSISHHPKVATLQHRTCLLSCRGGPGDDISQASDVICTPAATSATAAHAETYAEVLKRLSWTGEPRVALMTVKSC